MQENTRKCKKKCECLIDFWAASGAAIAPPSRPSARRARHRGCPTAPRAPACRSQGGRPPTCPVREAPTAAEKVPRPKMCPPVRTFPRIQPGAPGPPRSPGRAQAARTLPAFSARLRDSRPAPDGTHINVGTIDKLSSLDLPLTICQGLSRIVKDCQWPPRATRRRQKIGRAPK